MTKYERPEMEVIEFEYGMIGTTIIDASNPIDETTGEGNTPWIPRI